MKSTFTSLRTCTQPDTTQNQVYVFIQRLETSLFMKRIIEGTQLCASPPDARGVNTANQYGQSGGYNERMTTLRQRQRTTEDGSVLLEIDAKTIRQVRSRCGGVRESDRSPMVVTVAAVVV
ncbi:hypothetical protein BIW11_11077 [Tropilaelaps mercedesae]|uniref:Uncharacterized protein n=1 Tax=Tropilaelaps mercedesae TaxID=418985 RepID=A0A1V9XD39_9ACAR|nr:hypothetical protein BIW11_11077 [Tropilaelaps mercedesae]